MTLNFTETFDSNAVTSDLLRKWTGVGNWTFATTGGVSGGKCVTANAAASSLYAMFTSARFSLTQYFGYWVKIASNPSANGYLIAGLSAGLAGSGGLGIQTTGYTCAFNQQSQVVLGGVKNICDGLWHWIECACTLPASGTPGGTFTWYIDTLYQGATSSSDMFGFNVTTSWAGFAFNNAASVATTIGGLFMWDSGATFPSSGQYPVGPQEIVPLRPTSDSAVQFTPNTGSSNYTQINEVVPDDDASYVQALTGNAIQDLYGYATLGYSPVGITGVMVNTRVRNPMASAGVSNYRIIGKSGATQRNCPAVVAPSAYVSGQAAQQEFGVDPNTGAQWTAANFASATFGAQAI